MDKSLVYKKIEVARKHRFITNCYSTDVVEKISHIWSKEDEFLFSYSDNGVERLVYFAKDWNSVNDLLSLPENGKYFLEFMTKDTREFIPKGANLVAGMMRMANPDCRNVFEEKSSVLEYKDSVKVEIAIEADAKEINKVLWSTFRPEISHLISDEEIKNKIDNGQFSVHRNDNGLIDAILQADVMPKKFYINQIVNKTQKCVIHAILLNRLEQYVAAGGKYLFAWVEDKNIASVKFHEKYGLKHDGMWSMIYCLER